MNPTGHFRAPVDDVIRTARVYDRYGPRDRHKRPLLHVQYTLPPWYKRSPKWNVAPEFPAQEIEDEPYPRFTAKDLQRFDLIVYKTLKKTLAAWDKAEGKAQESLLPELHIVAGFPPLAKEARRRLQALFLIE